MKREIVEEYAELYARKAELESDLASVKTRIAQLEGPLVDDFAAEGLQSVKTAGGATLHLRREIWAGVADGYDRDALCKGLVDAGLAAFVHPSVNMQTLSAYFRERMRELSCEPDELVLPQGVKLTEKVSVRVRAS